MNRLSLIYTLPAIAMTVVLGYLIALYALALGALIFWGFNFEMAGAE